MRILTLFLALFLTLLPENIPALNFSQGQDVLMEEVVDVEEDVVIRTFRTVRIQAQEPTVSSLCKGLLPSLFRRRDFHKTQSECFERQWLTNCRLRL